MTLDLPTKQELIELLPYLNEQESAEMALLLNPTGTGIERLKLHKAQAQVVAESKRFNVVDCGRRWGKTELGQDLVKEGAIDWGAPTGWFSPTFNMMTDVWRALELSLYPLITAKNKQERYMQLSTGGRIDFWSLDNPDMARGRAYQRIVVDEAAMAPQLQYAWQNVIRPTLTDYKGDAWFKSTPKGRNYFYRLFLGGQDPDNPEWKSWQMPTVTNPYIDPAEVEAAREMLPQQIFAQEYLAEFVDDAGLVFRNVRNCLWEPPAQLEPGRSYSMGVDWAQSNDFTVLAPIDDLGRVWPLDRFNQIGWAVQRDRLRAVVDLYNVGYILAEANSIGGPNIEQLQSEGLPVYAFTTTNETKTQIVQALMLAFERGEIQIPDDPVLIGELEAFEASRLPSGKWKYEAPAGMHDDTVIALALAWWAHVGGDMCSFSFIELG